MADIPVMKAFMTGSAAIGGLHMPARPRTYSRLSQEALRLLGAQVRLARKQRAMTEAELAERVGVARSTLQLIEKGDPKVEIGLVFEAAILAGVDLFVPETATLAPQLERVADKIALLPQAIRRPREGVKDDF
jgi:transcriptional regulator with XRE-family HTH domain